MAKITKIDNPVVEEAKPIKPVKKATKKGTVINCTLLNVREEASTSAKVLKTIEAGTVVEILSTEGNFYKTAEGYVMKDYIDC